jgi:hypothetical protein
MALVIKLKIAVKTWLIGGSGGGGGGGGTVPTYYFLGF